MLKGISPLISPELLKILCEMGHGDEIVLADANFPSETTGKRVIRADGIGAADLLKAILPLFPLDTYEKDRFIVLKGDMSLVGTRPPLPGEVSEYEIHHRARLAIKPGITGMWQVSGRSDITDFEEVVRLDTKYIREWSPALDIKILFKTVKTVLGKEGSM